MPRRIDWDSVRRLFVEGEPEANGGRSYPGYREVAERTGVARRAVERHGSEERWQEQRALYQRRVEEQRRDQRVNELAAMAADFDLDAVRMAKDGMSITHARLQELGVQTQRRIAALGSGNMQAIAQNPPVEAIELDRLSRAGDTFYLLGTKAIGLGPRMQMDVEVTIEQSDDERDARTLETLQLLRQYAPDLLPAGFGDVIDVEGGLSLVAGNGQSRDGGDLEAGEQPVHPEVADNGQ